MGEIQFLREKLSSMQGEKTKQEKDHTRIFEQVETGQVRSINELERLYDQKLYLEQEKFLALEQENLQGQLNFDKKFKEF